MYVRSLTHSLSLTLILHIDSHFFIYDDPRVSYMHTE